MRTTQRERLFPFGGVIVATLALALAIGLTGCGRSPAESQSGRKAGAPVAAPFPKRFHHLKAGTPVFFFRARFADMKRSAFEFERLPSGAVRFMDAYDHREYVMTQPFEMEEKPLPESAADEGPEKDMSAKEKQMNERPRRYMISSYFSGARTRFSTFRYRIDEGGTVHFAHSGKKMAIPPPYVIEEEFLGAGNRPKIPDYPPEADRP